MFGKTTICKSVVLSELIVIHKYLMAKFGIRHISGYADSKYLNSDLPNDELEHIINSAVKHKLIINKDSNYKVDDLLGAFLYKWSIANSIVTLKKKSTIGNELIVFSKVGKYYLCVVENVIKDSASIYADENFDKIYGLINKVLLKKDKNIKYNLDQVNQILSSKNIGERLTIKPNCQFTMQAIGNHTGKPVDNNILVSVNGGNEELLTYNNDLVIIDVKKCKKNELPSIIKEYIDKNCKDTMHINGGDNSNEKKLKIEDKEPYTKLSFAKIISDENCPKGFFQFIKFCFKSIVKEYADIKKIVKGIIWAILLSLIPLFWNMYGLCFLNDSFRIQKHSVFGKATPYLLAGEIDISNIIGMPPIVRLVKTVTITFSLYFLISVLIKTLFSDIKSGKIKSNIISIFNFGKAFRNYNETSNKKFGFYFSVGIIISAVLNIAIFNPFSITLLAILLLFSCMKCENGYITPIAMYASSCIHNKNYDKPQFKAPLFANFQLLLLGVSLGLIIHSILNWILWFVMDFNFWVRIIIIGVLIIFALVRLGIIKINKSTYIVLLCLSIISVVSIIFLYNGIVFADDGGWRESGRNFAGLIKNSGFGTILAYSAILGVAALATAITFGAAVPIALSIGAVVASIAGIHATFFDYGRKTAYDFIYGDFSPYGGDSGLATALSIGVQLISPIGSAFGVVTGIRDCAYDIQDGDLFALGIDAIGLGLNGIDLNSKFGEFAGEALEVGATISSPFIRNEAVNFDDKLKETIGNIKNNVADNITNNMPKSLHNSGMTYDNTKTIVKPSFKAHIHKVVSDEEIRNIARDPVARNLEYSDVDDKKIIFSDITEGKVAIDKTNNNSITEYDLTNEDISKISDSVINSCKIVDKEGNIIYDGTSINDLIRIDRENKKLIISHSNNEHYEK